MAVQDHQNRVRANRWENFIIFSKPCELLASSLIHVREPQLRLQNALYTPMTQKAGDVASSPRFVIHSLSLHLDYYRRRGGLAVRVPGTLDTIPLTRVRILGVAIFFPGRLQALWKPWRL